MGQNTIKLNSLITFTADNTVWRLFFLLNGLCRMIDVEAEGFSFRDMDLIALIEMQTKGEVIVSEDEPFIVDKGAISNPNILKTFERNCAFSDEVRKIAGPDYTILKSKKPKPKYFELVRKYNLTEKTAKRIIVRWLQSGLQDCGLLDGREQRDKVVEPYNFTEKPGRKPKKPKGILRNAYCLAVFANALEHYRKSRTMTISDCFALYVECYFYIEKDGKVEKLPPDQRPTERQFGHYVETHLTYQEIQEIETSVEEFKNNERILFGTSRGMSIRPGFLLESDAVEMDLYLVSSLDPTRLVGRAVVYMLADVFSSSIVGASIGFENNSVMGLTNLFINFFVDKNKMLEDANVIIDADSFPSNFLPKQIRCDRGSDFKSDAFEEVCRQLQIDRELCTGATGSMKGVIEQSFRSFHNTYKVEFEHKGYIQKRYDSNHKVEAVATIEAVKKIVLLFIAYHNKKYNKKFKLEKDMVKAGVGKRPIDIWNYGVEKFGAPCPIDEKKLPQLLMDLLPTETATINREGIVYKRLYYKPFGDSELSDRIQLATVNARMRDKNGALLNRINVKVDPRSVNTLYYIKDGRIMQLILNNAKSGTYRDLTWAEYDEYLDKIEDMDADGEEYNRTLNEEKVKALQAIGKSVKKVVKKPSAMNIKEIRKAETQEINNQSAVSNFIPSPVPAVEEGEVIEVEAEPVTVPEFPENKKNPLSSKKAPDFL